jgi:aminoglycoside phosphotransferase family enzyme/predicted kinase
MQQAQPSPQDPLFREMSQRSFYPHPVSGVEIRDTHISKVFLTGETVYKIKKAVKYDFLDYLSLKRRKHFCHREIELNRRLTTGVYLDVVTVTRDDNRYCLNGPGPPVEYAVTMRQLPEECSLRKLLPRKKIGTQEIEDLARRLVEFYDSAASGPAIDKYGSIATISENCEGNFQALVEIAADAVDAHQLQIIRAATRSFLLRRRAIFEDRVKAGRIRDCHGDLRCGHIYFNDELQVIDCIEFNDRFRYSDVVCDLAYLLMDLEYEGFPEVANDLLDNYVRFSGDGHGFVLLDFYKCYRAMVKSKIGFIESQGMSPGKYLKKRLAAEAQKFLSLAYTYAIRFTRPTIWVVCGLPAAGKSTIAEKLSSVLHIDVLRSDRVRKEIFGVAPDSDAAGAFEEGLYSPGATALTYGKLFLSAQEIVEKDRSVILDATFSRRHQRQEALQLARDLDANILFIECFATTKCLKERLKEREQDTSLSDARVHHLTDLVDRFESVDDLSDERHLRIHTEKNLEDSIQQILAHDYYLLSDVQRKPAARP